MRLLSRISKLALSLLVLLALTAAPNIWSPHLIGTTLSAPPAWAGSPDETLKPPPTPKSSSIRLHPQSSAQRGSTSDIGTVTYASSARARFEQLMMVFRINLASVLRF